MLPSSDKHEMMGSVNELSHNAAMCLIIQADRSFNFIISIIWYYLLHEVFVIHNLYQEITCIMYPLKLHNQIHFDNYVASKL